MDVLAQQCSGDNYYHVDSFKGGQQRDELLVDRLLLGGEAVHAQHQQLLLAHTGVRTLIALVEIIQCLLLWLWL